MSSESYMRVVHPGQPDLFIPFEEIVDVSDIKQRVYLKRWLREINTLGWTRDPRKPAAAKRRGPFSTSRRYSARAPTSPSTASASSTAPPAAPPISMSISTLCPFRVALPTS